MCVGAARASNIRRGWRGVKGSSECGFIYFDKANFDKAKIVNDYGVSRFKIEYLIKKNKIKI